MSQRLHALHWLQQRLDRWQQQILAVSVLLLALLSISNVIARNLFGYTLLFSVEVNHFLLLLITFTGIAYAARRERHIRMSALCEQLPTTWRRAVVALAQALTALLLLVLGGFAVSHVASVATLGSVTPALRLPLWLLYLPVPIGLLLGGIEYLLALRRTLRDGEVRC